jgi:signal peptidase II
MTTAVVALVLIAVVDQVTKVVMLRRNEPIQFRSAGTHRRGVMTTNPGLVALPTRAAAALWIGAASAAIAVLVTRPTGTSAVLAVGIGLGIGGAFGNLMDRLARGGVVDFIAIGSWPPFNVADAGLVVGFGLVAMALL